jgi:hypothetical protein
LLNSCQKIENLPQKLKNGAIKWILNHIGIKQSWHITRKKHNFYAQIFGKMKYQKRNYFELDTPQITLLDKEVSASTILMLINLIGGAIRNKGNEKIVMAPFELKNLLSGAIGKQTINKNLLALDKSGAIVLRRSAIYPRNERGHCFSRWIITIASFLILFKSVNTSYKFSSLDSSILKRTLTNESFSRPPPCFFMDKDIEREFRTVSHENNWSSFNYFSQENLEEYFKYEEIKDIKEQIESINGQKKLEDFEAKKFYGSIKKALGKRDFKKRYSIYETQEENKTRNLPDLLEFIKTNWIPNLDKKIKNPPGLFVSCFKKEPSKNIIWDKFLKWSDQKNCKRSQNIVQIESTIPTSLIMKLCEITKESFNDMKEFYFLFPKLAINMAKENSNA